MKNIVIKTVCEEKLYKKIFYNHAKNIHSFLCYKFGLKYAVEDKVQEAFIKLWENCKKIPPEKAKSYVYKVATNLVLNEINHQKVKLKYNSLKKENINYESPEFVFETNEFSEKIQSAISNLTEAQRVAFLLNRVDGKKHKEIAEILSISTKEKKKRIYGAIKSIKKNYKIKV
ncbi:sigma-70 family RNA polymerase sigma factor [Polaribacter sp.]|uniref:RNA polymerase sigma factor n=1 Tax=Polaribacter sp. TaxID=1920175 RepID=UPI002631A62A|nr:sigma-70 family RNA polymerase sigma factor [Polaribacter sp.]MDG1402541.1 sigma-70 family RNA polymerase sigma factor [Polaribacter sp.]